MSLQPSDLYALSAPFPAADIHWRVGSTNRDKTRGMALAYIDARAVMDRLDKVCGPAGWQRRYTHAAAKTVCEIGLKVEGEWIWKADGADDTDFEATKGALSDAFKRAAVSWGIGRYLYSLDAPWVALEGGRYIAKGEMAKLDDIARRASGEGQQKSATGISLTELKAQMKALLIAIPGCATVEDLEALEMEYDDALRQCERDLPRWYFGYDDADGHHAGARERIKNRFHEIQQEAEYQPHV